VSLFKSKVKEKASPKFYCDNCGTEVGQEAIECPKCGRLFSSVRCPSCGFVGEVKLFDAGCPACGYSATPVDSEKFQRGQGAPKVGAPKHSAQANTLPLWVYLVAGTAFAGALWVLLLTIMK
jgi:predicted RNA-binding Zn-ribbon protein involved in translation (DUF1610 family)